MILSYHNLGEEKRHRVKASKKEMEGLVRMGLTF